MARKLIDIARVLRSKNAGPLYLTFDVMFDTLSEMNNVLASGVINERMIAELYEINTEDIKIIPYEVVSSLKITIPRKHVSGDLLDEDIYGCQQHMKLAQVIIPNGGYDDNPSPIA